MNMKNKFLWALRIMSAIILFQTLYFKFSAAPESVYIFETLHVEPWGRWFAGISELVAGLLLIVPGLEILGAFAAAGIMIGAISAHFLFLGIVVQDDGGLLFAMACLVLISSSIILYFQKETIRKFLTNLKKV